MTRTYLRFLIAIALAVAIEQVRTVPLAPWTHALRQSRVMAQALGNPAYGDPAAPQGMGISSNGPVGGYNAPTPYTINNNSVVTGPTAPITPTRPSTWPGGSEDPSRENSAPATGPVQEAPRRTLSEPPYDPAEIMARVGAETIQANEVLPTINQHLSKVMVQYADQFAVLPPPAREAEINKLRRQAMEHSVRDMVSIKLVLADVHQNVPAEALKKSDKQIRDHFNNHMIKELMAQYKASNISDLETKLREAGSSLDTQRMVFIEQQMVFSWMSQQVKEEKEPTHEQMLAYYQEHHADWETPAKARWEQLSIRFANVSDKPEAWRSLARWGNDIMRGAPFAEVAKAHSQDFASEEGGVHDWTGQGSLRSTVLDQVVFTLPPGALSQIIEDDEGFHIVRVLDRQDAKCTAFSEVQPEIKKRMQMGNENKQRSEYLAKLRTRTPVWTVFDEPAGDSSQQATAAATTPNAAVVR